MDEEEAVLIDIPDELLNLTLPNSYLLKYYQDLQNRIIWINDEITSDHTYELIHYIMRWNKEDKDIDPMDRVPIKIMFDSQGGDLDAQAAIRSVIELSTTPVIGVAIGMVASAASWIYLSCHLRLALKSSYFLLHKGSAKLQGDFENIISSIDDYRKEMSKMVQDIIDHSNYTKEEVEENMKRDWYVRAPEALEHGLVDEIITNINALLQ